MGRYSGKTCRLVFMLVITFVFFVAELVSGYVGNSIALVSDSFNMLSDVISLCVGITAARVSRLGSSGRRTYGLPRAEVVGALANAVFLTALCFTIFVEAVMRLVNTERIDDPFLVLIVGALGLAVNIVGLIIFQDCCYRSKRSGPVQEEKTQQPAGAEDRLTDPPGLSNSASDNPVKTRQTSQAAALNIRGVLLHVMGDALGSVVVVVAASLFYAMPLPPDAPCNWQCYVDPSLTIIMVIIILSSAFPLFKETGAILLQMVPRGLQVDHISEYTLTHTLTHAHAHTHISWRAVPIANQAVLRNTMLLPGLLGGLAPVALPWIQPCIAQREQCEEFCTNALCEALAQVPGVLSIHELHIWELAADRNVATLHLKCADSEDFQRVSRQVRQIFHNAGVHAVTIQPEYTNEDQDPMACNAPCLSEDCRALGCCSATHPSTNVENYMEISTCPTGIVCNGHFASLPDKLGISILPEHSPPQNNRDHVVLKDTQL
ncbi:Zinc transporter 10 [Acipenser ruthenus]|uniref:Zinc transporter 10 n=1 Tax=Acipenser ruthenus TaxID=7906 RepID=A0A444UQ64_ACIRT|nr:Zinc transporter 10 [Acipenser ruthenus]